MAMIRPCLPGLLVRRLLLDLLDHERLQPARGHHQLAPLRQLAVAGQVVEQGRGVLAEIGVAGEEAQVGVDAGRLRIVVAGGQVDVAADAVVLAADHQGHLAVRLQADEAEDDVDARLFQLAGPDDVAFLVQPGLQLDDGRHLLAVVGRPLQGTDDRRIAAGAVERLLDGQHALVVGGRLDEIDDVAERLVGMMHQDVAGADGRPEAAGLGELRHRLRHELRIAQVRDSRAGRESGTGRSDRAGPGCGRRRPGPGRAPSIRNCSTSGGASASISRRTAAAAAALADLFLDGLEQVFHLVVVDLVFAVARDAEDGGVLQLHAGEQLGQVQADDGFQRREDVPLVRPGSGTKRGSTAGTWTTANSFSRRAGAAAAARPG